MELECGHVCARMPHALSDRDESRRNTLRLAESMSTSDTALAVSGSPYDRGLGQGRAFRDAIAAHKEALLSAWRTIADASLIVSLEASSEGVMEVPLPAPDRSLHTNHPLARGPRYPEDEENSVARLRSLDDRLARGTPVIADLQGALTSFDDDRHPVCRLPSDDLGPTSFTTASMISALHGKAAPVEGWVSFGPPSQGAYQTFTLNLEHQR